MTSIIKVDNIQNAAGVAAITIDSNGLVAPKVPVFSVSLTSNTPDNLASNQDHLVDFSTYGAVDFDNTSAWDTANEKWTPQLAGYYNVNCTASSGAGTLRAAGPVLYKNGSTYMNHHLWLQSENYGDDIAASFTTIVYLNGSTDYIQLYVYVYDSSTGTEMIVGGNRRTNFSAHYISS